MLELSQLNDKESAKSKANLDDLNYRIDVENNVQTECVMNRSNLLEDIKYTSFTCVSCNLENICDLCYQTCHKSHNSSSKSQGGMSKYEKTVSIRDCPCQCAVRDHGAMNPVYYNSTKQHYKSDGFDVPCPINDLVTLLDPKHYYYDINDKCYYCLYCVFNCHQKNPDDSKHISLVTRDSVMDEVACGCSAIENHFPFYENVNNLSIMLKDKILDKYINRFKIPYQLLNNRTMIDKFINPFISRSLEIQRKVLAKNVQDSQTEAEVKVYNATVELIDNITDLFGQFVQFEIVNDTFSNILDVKYLITLFSYPEKKDDFLFKIKLDHLRFYRKFRLKPVISNTSEPKMIHMENYGPLHRLILKNVQSYDYNIKEVLELLVKVKLSIINYAEKIGSNDYSLLIVEFLKIYYIVLPHYHLDRTFLEEAVKNIGEVTRCLKKRKCLETLIRNILEKVLYSIMVMNNDFLLFTKLLDPENSSDLKIPDELVFSFQDSKFSMDIINVLFVFQKDSEDNSEYILRKDFYDFLGSEEDVYIQTLKDLVESKHFNFDFETLQQMAKCNNYDSIIEACTIIDSSLMKSLKSKIKDLEAERVKVLSGQITDRVYLQNISNILASLNNLLKIDILGIEQIDLNNDTVRANFNKRQIYVHKLGLFDSMVYTWNFLSPSMYSEGEDSLKKRNMVYNEILKIFNLITYENPFLTACMFNKKLVQIILDANISFLECYNDKMKTLEKYNYAIDGRAVVEKMTESLDFNQWYSPEHHQNVILCLKFYMHLLKVSTNKTVMQVNDKISFELIEIVLSNEFLTELEGLAASLEAYSNRCHNIGRLLSEDGVEVSRKTMHEILRLVYYCVSNLRSEYFYLIIEQIHIDMVARILKQHYGLEPELRRIFTKVYSRYYIESHFKILHDLTPETLNEYQRTIEMNLVTPTSNAGNDIHQSGMSGIDQLIENLEKFKAVYTYFSNDFKDKIKFTFKYFEDVILSPSVYAIYHIIHFSKDVDARSKYLVYNFIHLFLECTKYLISILKESDITNSSVISIIREYMRVPEGTNITAYFNNLLVSLNKDIALLNSDKFEQLNFGSTVKIYLHHSNEFTMYCKITKCEDGAIADSDNEFYNAIVEVLNSYNKKKADYYEDNILNRIFSTESENFPEIQELKTTIAYDLIYRFELHKEDSFSYYNWDNYTLLHVVNKLFKSDPNTWQSIVVDTAPITKLRIDSVITKQITFLFQFIFIEFHRLDHQTLSLHYKAFLDLIEFLRLLCEDHNKIFQSLLINYKIDLSSENNFLINFIFRLPIIVLTNVEYFKGKKNFIKDFRATKTIYFDSLTTKVTDFLIELIQGMLPFNFDAIANLEEFSQYYDAHYRFFDIVLNEEDYEGILADFIRLINCYIEENGNSITNKLVLVKRFNAKKLFAVLVFAFKELYIGHKLSEGPEKFEDKSYEKLLSIYINNDSELNEDPLFTLSTGIFIYLKRTSSYKCGEKSKQILDDLKEISQTKDKDLPEKNKQAMRTKKELFLFYDKIIKDVEISYKFKSSIEESDLRRYKELFENQREVYQELFQSSSEIQGLDKVIFLVDPTSLFLNEQDNIKFMESAPLDNFNTKLNFILNYCPNFLDTLKMRKILSSSKSRSLSAFSQVNYRDLEIVSGIMSFVTCISMGISIERTMKGNIIDPYHNHTKVISIIHLILLSLVILNWFAFTIYKMIIFIKEGPGILKSITKYLSLVLNIEVFPFVWNFIFGLMATMFERELGFLYALQLFTIFNIFPTMSSVLYAVRIRYKQFLSTGFLLIILMLFYSSITLYFFRDSLFNEGVGENICGSYLQCFLYLMNYGIRSGSGVGFGIKKIGQAGYWTEFIFDWVFYFIVILIIINIINGIIVDTFQALREQNNEIEDIKYNVCFICSLNRSKFESKGINFEDHCMKDHNILNYLEYIIKIQMTDEHDLNSLDYEVLRSIRDHRTDFFPIKKAKCLESKN